MNPYYKDYSEYLSELFPSFKVQKISVNAGFTCPNRDGTIGTSGCIYCDNTSFSPSYCMEGGKDVATQLEEGKKFFGSKYPDMRYLAYFQSFTNTYRSTPAQLRDLWQQAANVPKVVGIIVGTRPDTVSDSTIEVAADLNKTIPVLFEIGVETSDDDTLRIINRGHSWAQTVDTIRRLDSAGLHCDVHLIAGLPGETRERSLQSVADVCQLPIRSLKMHQLQVLRGTPLSTALRTGTLKADLFTCEEYLDFCTEVIRIVPRHIAIERFMSQAPPHMIEAPAWGIKNHVFTDRLHKMLNNQEELKK